jgi:hypothetical protein
MESEPILTCKTCNTCLYSIQMINACKPRSVSNRSVCNSTVSKDYLTCKNIYELKDEISMQLPLNKSQICDQLMLLSQIRNCLANICD